MFEKEKKIFRTLNILLDVLVASSAFLITFFLRKGLIEANILNIKPIGEPVIVTLLFPLMSLLYPLLLYINRFYPAIRLRRFIDKFYIILKTILQLVLLIIFGTFIFNIKLNRTLIIFSCPILFGLALFKEVIISSVILTQEKKRMKSTLIIGNKRDIDSVLKRVREEKLPIEIIEEICATTMDKCENKRDLINLHIDIERVIKLLDNRPIELVIIAGFHGIEEDIKIILTSCEERGIEVWLENPLLIRKNSRTSFEHLADLPMLVFSSVPAYNWQMFAKTLFDYTVALLSLPLFCVIYIIVGICIKLNSPGPVIFKQKRGGLYGKPFVMYKFRTMIKDAEQRKSELQRFNIMKGPVFKLKDDPRVFPFGKFLRRFSIDELPQIINVLKGDMSIVGPRPLPIVEVRRIKGADRRRFSMKPGLTCLWQISGRSEIQDFNQWVELDLEYIDNWSLMLDMKIIFKTIPAILFERKGAY